MSSGEFRYGTATLTFLATPERAKVLDLKALAAAVAGASFGLAGGIATTATGLVFAVAKSDPIALSSATLLGHIGGTALAGALLAAVGVGLGSLVHGGQLGAVIGVFIWCLIGESVLDGVYPATGRYLPFTAAASLAGSRVGGAFYAAGAAPAPATRSQGPRPCRSSPQRPSSQEWPCWHRRSQRRRPCHETSPDWPPAFRADACNASQLKDVITVGEFYDLAAGGEIIFTRPFPVAGTRDQRRAAVDRGQQGVRRVHRRPRHAAVLHGATPAEAVEAVEAIGGTFLMNGGPAAVYGAGVRRFPGALRRAHYSAGR